MTYDRYEHYEPQPQYPGGQPEQQPQYPQYPQQPGQYPSQYRQQPTYPQPEQYPPTQPYPQHYPQGPQPSHGGYPPGSEPTAPVIPPQGGGSSGGYGAGTAYGGGQYGGGQYGGGQYGQYGGGPAYGWPASPPPQPPKKSRTGLVVGLVAGGVALLLVLTGIGVAALRVLGDDPPGGDPAGPNAGGGPFAGTPAEQFAEGAAGIQLPEATTVGDFSAEQVADALGKVKDALVATRLDGTMLVDRDPEPFLEMMSPDNQPGLRKAFDDANFGHFASQVADGAALAVPTARVQGEITFEATTDDQGYRVIEVVTSFVWAYAFEVTADDPELDGVVVVRDRLVWQVAHPDDVADSSLGLWLWDGEAYAWGIDCDQFDQSLLAPQTETSTGLGAPEDEGDVFDPSGSLDVPDTC